jgi:hypothetical protein
MRFVAPFLLLVLTNACGGDSCDLRADLVLRAGAHATDCGHVELGADTTTVDDCVVDALGTNKPFFAQYDRQGTDSKIVLGIAGDGDGNVVFLLWDGDPSGGSGADPVIMGDECINPSPNVSPDRDPAIEPPIACESSSSLGRTCG